MTVTGGPLAHGRVSGRARSADAGLHVDVRLPTGLGGSGAGPNPEQLFAAGYAASLHGTLSVLAREAGVDPAALTVAVTVAVGRDPAGGHRLRADVVVTGLAADLVERAKTLCPYTKLLTG